ncbi:hypothetical protein RclHR1_00110023 [Rhizophagus clarus]|uniref:MARVEL domain-containing protein n=1 Tax=Rhizophagus clarus TaxID=94130 RepID=A0A2Z6Q332_9GLOM|nr:hypothetical protein RclHR1_00110023 [Rhizophagus clarus]GES97996.1 hypothetical protein GLOIN_2v1522835 [Rhizophagus clarus]
MELKANNLFLIIPPYAGAVIIPLLWLIAGIIVIVKFALDIRSSDKEINMFIYSEIYTILVMVISGLTVIGAIAAIALCSMKKILAYFIITLVIGVMDIIGNIAALAVYIVHEPMILKSCYNHTSDNSSCDDEYDKYLAIAIISTIISLFLSVHFIIVVNKYKHETGP